ncbi:MAG: hypothetical protein ACKPEA_00395 [Planctomycetota bacterium]
MRDIVEAATRIRDRVQGLDEAGFASNDTVMRAEFAARAWRDLSR